MRKYKASSMGILLAFSLYFIGSSYAASINAISCSMTDVQAAINSAITGDTVAVPPGSCTWSSEVSIPHDKKIILQGAGMNSTHIRRSSIATILDLNRSGSRVTGFDITDGVIEADGHDFRIDHCRMSFSSWSDGIAVMSRDINPAEIATGLIDNCEFYNMRVLVNGTNFMLNETGAQHGLWESPLGLGTANAVYIEDNVFTDGTNAVDGNYGGSFVFRYNILNDTMIEAHSVQGNNRAIRKWEIYDNTINQVSKSMWVPMFLRGGTGVVFNNTFTGTWTDLTIKLDNVRSCSAVGPGGRCNGNSSWDGNQQGEGGYPCRDQIGRSSDQWLWTNGTPYPSQASEPVYTWNNKYGNNDIVPSAHGNCAAQHILENRDFYSNIQNPNYTPYTYPHPLRDELPGDELQSFQPVQNLRIISSK